MPKKWQAVLYHFFNAEFWAVINSSSVWHPSSLVVLARKQQGRWTEAEILNQTVSPIILWHSLSIGFWKTWYSPLFYFDDERLAALHHKFCLFLLIFRKSGTFSIVVSALNASSTFTSSCAPSATSKQCLFFHLSEISNFDVFRMEPV